MCYTLVKDKYIKNGGINVRILVCIKQVPGSNNVEVDPVTGVLKRNGIKSKLTPYDLYAIETALSLCEKFGGEVEVITMGPPQAKEIILEAVCMGAKCGTVLTDRKFAGADVLATAYTISQGIVKAGEFDLIICGKQTTDGDTAQVGAEVSEYLGLPNISNVLSVENMTKDEITLTASLDEKVITMKSKLPCLISVEGDINTPRLPSYKIKQQLTDDVVKFISLNDFDDKDEKHYGLAGSATQVERIFPPEKTKEKRTISGDSGQQTEALFEIITEQKLI